MIFHLVLQAKIINIDLILIFHRAYVYLVPAPGFLCLFQLLIIYAFA